jgi:hypothetical protein
MNALSQEKRVELLHEVVNQKVIANDDFSKLIGELSQEMMLVYNSDYRKEKESRISGFSSESKESDLTIVRVWDDSGLAIDLMDSEKSAILNSISVILFNISSAISEEIQQIPFEEASKLCRELGYKETSEILDTAADSCPNGKNAGLLYGNQDDFYDDLYERLQGDA